MPNRCHFVLVFVLLWPSTNAWLPIFKRNSEFIAKHHATILECHSETEPDSNLYFYDHDGAKISYRKYESFSITTQQRSAAANLLLIHPVGIGQSAWFWDRFIADWFQNSKTNSNSTSTVYTVNLLGCGVNSERNALWNMTKQTKQCATHELSEFPVSLPLLSWVEQCETMIKEVICPKCSTQSQSNGSKNQIFRNRRWNFSKSALRPAVEGSNADIAESKAMITIVAQGGLAPVAILLAARNPSLIKDLILTSPPTFEELTKNIPESELRFNYKALCNPILEKIAFRLLESRWAIKFFSDLFLFARQCDSEWIIRTINESGPDVRQPVQLFNAGYCSYRSFQEELCNEITQPTLIVRGKEDTRDCLIYAEKLRNCYIKIIDGKNVLPWESSQECCAAIQAFLNTAIQKIDC